MLHPRPRSFRRLLFVRILLFSMPILLVGQYVTIRKARTSLLETARQNLASSAVRKAVDISRSIRSVQSNIQTLSQTRMLETGSLDEIRAFLPNYLLNLPQMVDCVQLNDGNTDAVAFNSCGTPLLPDSADLPWLTTASVSAPSSPTFALVDAGLAGDPAKPSRPFQNQVDTAVTGTEISNGYAQLNVIIAAPVYAKNGTLRYTLTLRARLVQLENTGPRSLVGDTVVIDQNGRILTHPDGEQIGQLTSEVGDADRLASILRNVQRGSSSTIHLFEFQPQGKEWLAGFTGVDIPLSPTRQERWSILAVTPLDHALQGLKDIRNVLILLTLGLLAANGVLAVLVARSLSLPIEQLSHYAQNIQDLSHLKEAPENFQVTELKHLALVLTRMMKRLEDRAQELRHAWQDAQMANQLKSEFLANTSHELRTPLNAIIGCIRLVRDECCDNREEELEFLERADNAAIHLLRIINDILDIAKIESGKLTLKPETFNLQQVLSEVIDLQMLHLRQKGLTLVQPNLTAPLWVVADRAKLKQVLINIVYNAIKFTDEGQIAIEVQVETEASPSVEEPRIDSPIPLPRVQIRVIDTGIGIDPQQQHKLFRPFVMVDGSTTRRFEGTGLGLAISKNLMDLMGGSIHLFSEGLGQGTTVVLALPLAEAPHGTEDHPAATETPQPTDNGNGAGTDPATLSSVR